jgi:beta-phosphoglucomutase-like phosphatase (HAD superfamily)
VHAADSFGVLPQNCIVIEDSIEGAMAAKNARMKCYAYCPGSPGLEFARHGASVFQQMAQLPQIFSIEGK